MSKRSSTIAKSKWPRLLKFWKKEFLKIRTGRANPNLLENVFVDYYGTPTSVLQVAGVSAPDPRTLAISPWDKKLLPAIERAISMSDIGITPQNDGNLIRLPVPPLNDETRGKLIKKAKKTAEDSKVALRNIRREAMTELKKMESGKVLSKDELKRENETIDKKTEAFVKKVNEATAEKERQLSGN